MVWSFPVVCAFYHLSEPLRWQCAQDAPPCLCMPPIAHLVRWHLFLSKVLTGVSQHKELSLCVGESTTMALIAERWGLVPELKSWAKGGRPIWGTCAGLIFLADRASGLTTLLPLTSSLLHRHVPPRRLLHTWLLQHMRQSRSTQPNCCGMPCLQDRRKAARHYWADWTAKCSATFLVPKSTPLSLSCPFQSSSSRLDMAQQSTVPCSSEHQPSWKQALLWKSCRSTGGSEKDATWSRAYFGSLYVTLTS